MRKVVPHKLDVARSPSTRPFGNSASWGLPVVHVLFVLGFFALLVSAPFQAQALPLEGQPAPTTVVAPSRVTYIDTVATNRRKLQVEEAVPPVLDSNLLTAEQNRQQAAVFFQNVDSALASSHLTLTRKRQAIQQLLQNSATSSSTGIDNLPILSTSQWHAVQYWSLHLLSDSLELPHFDSTQDPAVVLSLLDTLPRAMGPSERNAVVTVVNAFLTPTLVEDLPATQRKQVEAAAAVRPISTTIPAGTIIVRRGQHVTPAIMQELLALGLPTEAVDWHQRVGSILFAAILLGLLLWYLRLFHPDVLANTRLLLLIDVMFVATAIVAKEVIPGHVLLPYFFPLAAVSALCTLLAPAEVGLAVTTVLALLVGWVIGGSFELTVYYLLTGITGVLAVRNLRRVNDFILAGMYVASAAFLVNMSFRLLDQSYDLVALRNYTIAAGFNGLLSAALPLGGFALLAGFFGVTTTLQLLELAHPDQKLLRKLMVEASGTYNHSLVLASMVERAARDVGANALLAKVSALYHDIGKITNPQCFIENQLGIPNIHDELRPSESARLVKAHVTHGLRLAKQHRLPAVIRDAIAQHHGTMTMPYFWHRAVQEDIDAEVATYSYPGPRPRTKECAILMLADGCEPAVRANSVHSPEIIAAIVNRMIDERVASGQLSECELTLSDLEAVRRAFVDVLNSLYHPRIEYPDPVESPLSRPKVGA